MTRQRGIMGHFITGIEPSLRSWHLVQAGELQKKVKSLVVFSTFGSRCDTYQIYFSYYLSLRLEMIRSSPQTS